MQKYKDQEFVLSYILLLTAWMLQPGKSENTCIKLKFVNMNDQNKVITAEEGRNFSVKFYISDGDCHKNNETLVVAVSKVDNNYIVPVCKIPFYANHTCEVSHSSEQCSCVNASVAQFQTQASQAAAGVYIWSVGDARTRNVRDVNITFRVTRQTPSGSARNGWLVKAAIIGGPVTFFLLTSAAVTCIAMRRRRRRRGRDEVGVAGVSNPSDFDNCPVHEHPVCSVDFHVIREENNYDDIMSNASQHVYAGDSRQAELPLTYLEPIYQKSCKRELRIPTGAMYFKR